MKSQQETSVGGAYPDRRDLLEAAANKVAQLYIL